MNNFVKATLVGRITKDGLDLIKETVPIGKQYEVLPESITKGLNCDQETKKVTPLQIILAKNDDGTLGYLPLELLKLEEN